MNPLIPSLQKIIIEYCHYPKLYSEELEYGLRLIYYFIKLKDIIDFGYTYYHVTKHPKDGWLISSNAFDNIRKNLITKKENRDKILNVGRVYYNFHSLGYYPY